MYSLFIAHRIVGRLGHAKFRIFVLCQGAVVTQSTNEPVSDNIFLSIFCCVTVVHETRHRRTRFAFGVACVFLPRPTTGKIIKITRTISIFFNKYRMAAVDFYARYLRRIPRK